MAGDTVQKIKDRLSIVDVVSGYVKLQRSGTALKARCPFHAERTPSFTVSPERGTYHCFGCGEGGDIFTFVEKIEGVDFKGALKMLADRAGVPIEYAPGAKRDEDERDRLFAAMEAAALFCQTCLTPEARTYLSGRGLTDASITGFRIGWAGNGWTDMIDHLRSKKFSDRDILAAGLAREGEKGLADKFRNRIMFPLADTAGRVVAFSGRTFGPDAHPEAPKYLNSPETPLYHKSSLLYGYDKAKQAMRQLNAAILVEGQMDLVMSHQAGWTNTVAVSGTAFTTEHAVLIKRQTENLILALDADEAGFKAAGKAARAALAVGLRVKVARIPGEKDPADLILHDGPEAWRACIKAASDVVDFLLDVLEEKLPQPDRFRRAAETIVVPFVAEVQSPIDRDAYVRRIAARIGVSESAVAEALARAPREHRVLAQDDAPTPQPIRPVSPRIEQGYAFLIWQESLTAPQCDTEALAKALEDAAGTAPLSELRSRPSEEQERMRFEGERLYGKSDVKREAQELPRLIERERLESELRALSAEQARAEAKGDEAGASALEAQVGVLTTRIAQLHMPV